MEKKVKYFVVSLPRTGTTTLSKMAKIVGLEPKHCPNVSFLQLLNNSKYDFYSDTPIFTPSTIDIICANSDIEPRFIYISRDFGGVFGSWVNVDLYGNYLHIVDMYNNNNKDKMSGTMLFDYESYNEAFNGKVLDETNFMEIFNNHKNAVIDKIVSNNHPLLYYNFTSGWKPFCDFLGVDVPDVEIPILNKNKMFEQI